jgi:hypothetical protein
MKAELNGTYGSQETPCTVYYYNGWYCVDGSVNVNRTDETLSDGVDVELVNDYDCFTWNKPIESLDELIEAVNS